MDSLYQLVTNCVNSNWEKVLMGVGAIALTGMLKWLRNVYAWHKAYSKEYAIVSLNTFKGNVGLDYKAPQMITIMQKKLHDMIDNPVALKIFLKAANKTTAERPFIDLGKSKEAILMPILNEISAGINAIGAFYKDMNLPIREEIYVFAPTYERYTGMRFLTTRFIVVKKSYLTELNMFDGEISEWKLKKSHHYLRIETLRAMQRDVLKKQYKYCMEFSVVLPD